MLGLSSACTSHAIPYLPRSKTADSTRISSAIYHCQTATPGRHLHVSLALQVLDHRLFPPHDCAVRVAHQVSLMTTCMVNNSACTGGRDLLVDATVKGQRGRCACCSPGLAGSPSMPQSPCHSPHATAGLARSWHCNAQGINTGSQAEVPILKHSCSSFLSLQAAPETPVVLPIACQAAVQWTSQISPAALMTAQA